jgi:hypothetical protein
MHDAPSGGARRARRCLLIAGQAAAAVAAHVANMEQGTFAEFSDTDTLSRAIALPF